MEEWTKKLQKGLYVLAKSRLHLDAGMEDLVSGSQVVADAWPLEDDPAAAAIAGLCVGLKTIDFRSPGDGDTPTWSLNDGQDCVAPAMSCSAQDQCVWIDLCHKAVHLWHQSLERQDSCGQCTSATDNS